MKKLLLITMICLAAPGAFAQFTDSYKAQGDKAFNNKDYYEAAYYYKREAMGMNLVSQREIPFRPDDKINKKTEPADKGYIAYQLAESYRLYENYLEAESWYYKIINQNLTAKYPLARLWYGVCLRADQHFDEAIVQLTQFTNEYRGSETYLNIANKELANCRFAKEDYQYPSLFEVNKLKGDFNSDGSDYAISSKGADWWLTSSRMAPDDKKHVNRIYHLTATTPLQMVAFKNIDNKKDAEYGTPSVDPTGQHMYFTRWYKEGAKSYYIIYMSTMADNGWGTPAKLNANVNIDGFKAIQPFVTADGKRLFFVSNKPGGQGGDDIWVSDLDAGGMPTNSNNLGATVNTAMDEQAPYYSVSQKKLIYSSKGFTGLGGFDFFESFENYGTWTEAHNLGYPMNSAKDDIYYLPDSTNPDKFYISSDRESDCCLNLFEVYDKKYVLNGMVVDCDSHKPLVGAKVTFIDSLSKKTVKEEVLGPDAQYTFNVTTKRPYSIMLEKKGYFTKILPVPAKGEMRKDTLLNKEICLQPFEVNKPIVINNVLYDYNKADLRPESKIVLDGLVKIMMDNPKIKVELSAHTDSVGSDAYNLKLSQDRAQACVDYMISQGVSDTRIFAKGYGKTKPIAPNSLPNGKDNPEGRQLNRRTEFTVLKTE